MSISQFATYVNPLIATLKKLGGSARPREVVDAIATEMQLPDAVLDERLANGVPRYENQVHWARAYLAEMGYIDRSRRGVWSLTEKGWNAPHFSEDALRQLIRDVQQRVREGDESVGKMQKVSSPESEDAAPDAIEGNYREKVLAILKDLPPAGFERLCQRLLRESSFEQGYCYGAIERRRHRRTWSCPRQSVRQFSSALSMQALRWRRCAVTGARLPWCHDRTRGEGHHYYNGLVYCRG